MTPESETHPKLLEPTTLILIVVLSVFGAILDVTPGLMVQITVSPICLPAGSLAEAAVPPPKAVNASRSSCHGPSTRFSL